MRAFVTGGSGFVGRNLIPFLTERGYQVAALARSEGSAEAVKRSGAEPVMGDLDDLAALERGCTGADFVFHAAAYVKDWGPLKEMHAANVEGTLHVLEAAKKASVKRVVHVGTEAVLVDGSPIVRADETRPLPARSIGRYSLTKKLAEQAVLAASKSAIDAVVIRPRFIWGKGDTTLLVELLKAVDQKRFAWVDGGRYLTSTCHVKNVCHGAVLAAERGVRGGVYFLTDGEPVEFRGFITKLLETQSRDPGDRSMPGWLARGASSAIESVANVLGRRPPLTRAAMELIGREVTVNDGRARTELGYDAIISIDEGLAEMRV